MGKILDGLQFDLSEAAVTNPSSGEALRRAIDEQFNQIKADYLYRYVPYRLLSPFFDDDLKGLQDDKKNDRIRKLANQRYSSSNPPLYRFIDDDNTIDLHTDWVGYLTENFSIVRGWALNEWATYLQQRNPNTPAILSKIAPPLKRPPLDFQRKIWETILGEKELICIYSNQPLDPYHFQLDHFIPWSFICHDQLWNLIPATPSENSSKGRSLPSTNQVDAFIKTQEKAIASAKTTLTAEQWRKIKEEYSSGLNLDADQLLDSSALRKAYEQTLNPLISLADQFGF